MTVTPGTGLLPRSRTTACSGKANAPRTWTVCEEPPLKAIDVAAPATFVRPNVAGVPTPAADAVRL